MTIPANLQLEQAPYGPQPVVLYFGPQGGPYTVGQSGGVALAGPDAEGAAPTVNPVRVAGWDGTFLRTFATNATGRMKLSGGIAASIDSLGTPTHWPDDSGSNRPLAAMIGGWTGGAGVGSLFRIPNVFKDVNAVALVAGTGATVWTPAAGKKFRLMGGWFSSSAAAALIFGDNAVGTVIFRSPLLAAAGVFTIPPIGNGVISAAANNVLKLDVSVASTVTGCVFGTEE